MRDLGRRLARLETWSRAAENAYELPRLFVLWKADPLPEGLCSLDLIIRLARDEEEPHASKL